MASTINSMTEKLGGIFVNCTQTIRFRVQFARKSNYFSTYARASSIKGRVLDLHRISADKIRESGNRKVEENCWSFFMRRY